MKTPSKVPAPADRRDGRAEAADLVHVEQVGADQRTR
jgi:hypothetical protein